MTEIKVQEQALDDFFTGLLVVLGAERDPGSDIRSIDYAAKKLRGSIKRVADKFRWEARNMG